MPFTLAHPGIVLPLGAKQSRYIDLTGLVIGSMSPDFEYFLHFKPIQIVGHSFLAQFYLNLPLTFLIAFLYHYLLKKPFIYNLPEPYCGRLGHFAESSWRPDSLLKLGVFIYSTLLGAFSHLLWDGFTHKSGYFVEKIALFSTNLNLLGMEIPVYKLMQHGGTLFGFILIFIFLYLKRDRLYYLKKRTKIEKASKIRFWTGVLVLTSLVIGTRYLQSGGFGLGEMVVTTIDAFFIGILIVSIFLRIRDYLKEKVYE